MMSGFTIAFTRAQTADDLAAVVAPLREASNGAYALPANLGPFGLLLGNDAGAFLKRFD